MANSNGMKRYSLVLPEELFNKVQEVADRKYTTVVEILRRFIMLGLLAVDETPGTAVLFREGDTERQIMLL